METRPARSSIWYALPSAQTYVYPYTSPKSLEAILDTGTLRFSRFANLNDPRESKNWVLDFFSRGADLELADQVLQDELNRHLKHRWRVVCFCTDVEDAFIKRPGGRSDTMLSKRCTNADTPIRACGISMRIGIAGRASSQPVSRLSGTDSAAA